MCESFGLLRADFRRFYGHSIDEFRGMGVPLSEVADLAAHLPPESVTFRKYNPDYGHDHELELLRRLEFSASVLVWAQGKRKKHDWPALYMFPWEDDPNRVIKGDVMTTDEVDEWLGWSVPA